LAGYLLSNRNAAKKQSHSYFPKNVPQNNKNTRHSPNADTLWSLIKKDINLEQVLYIVTFFKVEW